MPPRRNLKTLQQAVADARSKRARASALYCLAVFHNNNGREATAIPYYRQALAAGLDRATEVFATTWLASSLYKTGHPTAAMRSVRRALAGRCSPELKRFLGRLKSRIERKG